MATHLSCYEILSAQHAASPVIGPHRTWTTSQIGNDDFEDKDNPILTEALLPGWVPPSLYRTQDQTDTPLRHFFGHLAGTEQAAAVLACVEAESGPAGTGTVWAVNGVACENGVSPFRASLDPQWCRCCPPVQLVIDGAVETAVDNIMDTIISWEGTCHWSYPKHLSYQGLLHFCDMEERPPNTNASGWTRLHELLQLVGSPSARQTLGATAGGTTLYALDCNLATFSPEGLLFIDPSDIGNGPDQIPVNVADNTATRLRCHPSTFLRRSQYVRHITRQISDYYPVTQLAQASPLTYAVVGSAPTYSRWLISVDGCPYVVQVSHGTQDLRRARDIWNSIWVPHLQASQSNYLPISGIGYDGIQTGITTVLARLPYLEYARMLGCDGQITYYEQTGITRLG